VQGGVKETIKKTYMQKHVTNCNFQPVVTQMLL